MRQTAALVLAAGGSRRLGQPKQLLLWDGEPLIRRAARVALVAGCSPVAVVLGAERTACIESLAGLTLMLVDNTQWEAGMGSSIRAGLCALQAQGLPIDAVILLLCDQPLVTPEILASLAARYSRGDVSIVASRYADAIGAPALFGAAHFNKLATVESASGAKSIILGKAAEVAYVDFPSGSVDLDTPEDLIAARALDSASP